MTKLGHKVVLSFDEIQCAKFDLLEMTKDRQVRWLIEAGVMLGDIVRRKDRIRFRLREVELTAIGYADDVCA